GVQTCALPILKIRCCLSSSRSGRSAIPIQAIAKERPVTIALFRLLRRLHEANLPNALKFCCSAGLSQNTPTGRHDKRGESPVAAAPQTQHQRGAFTVAASSNFLLNETALAHGSFDSSSIRKLLPAV